MSAKCYAWRVALKQAGVRQHPERARPAPAVWRRKTSGTGREGGEYSFEVFAEMKTSAFPWATIQFRNGESDMGN